MCECLRGIFRVTWTPSSDADSDIDREDSHVFNQTRDRAVKHKRRSPPSTRSPSAPQRTPHHSSAADEQESPERVEQKEKLHAELKQVLSQKRSHLRDSTCQLAQAEMDSEPAEEQTNVEEVSKAMEIMVETEAEVGASGYSVTGGGEQGIFVKDVLKDSPAAKHLSLQQGDQLLSAKVYFDNVKYEDALRILQCAEPYKVSFQLKRTVPEAEVSVRPRVPSVDVKNPKVKSVKGTKPFKALKKRGGRFGLKRLKEKHREEHVIEGTPPRLETGDVDLEVSLPKIKQRKSGKFKEEDIRGTTSVGKAKRRIRFPHMKVKKYARTDSEGKVETGQLEGHVNIPPSEIPEAKVKAKGKGHKFGIKFPKTKHIKSDSCLESGSVELEPPDVSLQPPSVEFSLSGNKDKDLEKRGSKFNPPDVEFALPLGKPEVPKVKVSAGIKAPKVDIKGEAEAAEGKINVDSGMGDTKLKKPKLKLPKVRLSRHSDEIDGEIKVKAEGMKIPHVDVKTKGDGKVRLPETQLTKPKVKGEAGSLELPSVDVSLPKVKFDTDGSLQDHEGAVKMPAINISVPKVDLEFDTGQRIPDEVEGTIKGTKISMPKVDISLPKMGSPNVDIECPDGAGEFNPPSVDSSIPTVQSDVDMDYYVGGDGKFKMPEFGITLPKVKPSEQEVERGFKLPKVDLTLPKYKSDHEGDGKFQLPSLDVSLPKGEVEVGTKLKKPDISLPKGKIKGDVEMEGHVEKGGKFKMPSAKIILPEIGTGGAEVDIQGPKIKGEKIKVPSVDISLPKPKGEANIEGNVKGGKFSMPSVNISLPKTKFPEGDFKVEGPELPNVDLSLPISNRGGNVEYGGNGSTKFNMPTIDISLPKGKIKELEVDIKEPRVKGGAKVNMPSLDISLPATKSPEGEITIEGSTGKKERFQMPSLDVSLPQVKKPESDISIEGPDIKVKLPKAKLDLKGGEIKEGKFNIPTPDISLPEGKTEGKIEIEGRGSKVKMPSFDVSLPKMKSKQADINIKGPELKSGDIKAPTIDISTPQGSFEGDIAFDGEEKGGAFKLPSVDISLPGVKLPEGDVNIQGPKVKGGKFEMPKIDLSLPKGKEHGNIDIDIHSGMDGNIDVPSCGIGVGGPKGKTEKFKMPKVDITLPKLPEVEGKIEMPAVDISLPKEKLKGDLDIDPKGAKFHIPSLNINLPKVKSKEASIDVKGQKGKFEMPWMDITQPKIKSPEVDVKLQGTDVDISFPKVKAPEGDVTIKQPEIKGRKIELPDIDISLPKGKLDGELDIHGRKGGKFQMPSVDFSLPKLKTKGQEVNIDGPEIKQGNINMPDIDFSLSKGTLEGDINVEGPDVKGGKFKMPKFDVSLPKVSLPKVEGPDIKGKFELPTADISLPKPKAGVDIDVDTGKGSKFHLPSVDFSLPKIKTKGADVDIQGPSIKGDVSLPKVKSPEVDVSLKGPDIQGAKIDLPSVDISLPKGKIDGDFDVEGPEVKGGKFKMPKIDVSLPKVNLPEGDLKIKGPDIKTGKITMPDIDISLPKGKVKGGIEAEGHAAKGGKFHMPSIDITLPKMKAKGPEIDVEGPKIEGGKVNMPSLDVTLPKIKSPKVDISLEGPDLKGETVKIPTVDVSLPKGTIEGDINVEGPDVKGGKFKMPKFDVSLPKVSLPKVEGPDIKGKFELPTADISLPKPKADVDIDVDTGKGSKFHLPSVDFSLPKIKTKGADVDIQGPSIKGDVSLPKVKSPEVDVSLKGPDIQGAKIDLPSVDISPPKGKIDGDFDVEGPEVKGGKFKMPKIDVSLPKVNLPEGNLKIKGPDIKTGKITMPDIDISLPKGKAKGEIEIEGHYGNEGKIHMPSIPLPKFKGKEPQVNIEAPQTDIDIKGPNVKGGKLKMPTVAISLPKVNLPEGDVKVEGVKVKEPKIEVPAADISLPEGNVEGDVNIRGPSGMGKFEMPKAEVNKKGGRLQMPSLDINLSKFDLDLSLPSGTKDKGFKMEASGLDATGDLELSDLKGNIKPAKLNVKGEDLNTGGVEGSGASLKLPSVKLPTVDISAPKVDLDFGLTKPKGDDVEVELLKAEGERPYSGGSFDLPDVSLKVPSFSLPRIGGKSKSGDLEVSGPKGDVSFNPPSVEGEIRAPSVEFDRDGKVKVKKTKMKMPSFEISKKDADVSVSCPDVDVKMKSRKPDIPKVDFNIEGPDGKAKHKVKFPKFKMSSRKVQLPEEEVDDKVEADVEGKAGFHVPDVTIKLPKFSIPGFGSKEKDLGKPNCELEVQAKGKMPSVELSLPAAKTPETEVLLPKSEVDVSEADIKGYEGNLKIPKMPTMVVSIPKVDLDVSLPKGKSQRIEGPDVEFKGGEGKFKMPGIKMPTIDISKEKTDKLKGPDVEMGGEGKLKMPNIKMSHVDIGLPKMKTPEVDAPDFQAKVESGGAKFSVPYFQVPSVDMSLPKAKAEVEMEGSAKQKFKMPSTDISLPKGKFQGTGAHEMAHIKMPNVAISLPKEKTEGPELEIKGEGGKFKMPHIAMPSVDISLPKGKVEGFDVEGDGREKVKIPYMKMPSVDISAPKGKTDDSDAEMKGNMGGKFKLPHVKMPNVEFSGPKGKDSPEMNIKGQSGNFKVPHVSMPSVDISLPKGKFESPEVEIEKDAEGTLKMPHVKMPNVEISLPKGKSGKIKEMDVTVEGEGNLSKIPSVDISLPKVKTEGPDLEIKGEGGKFKMPKVDISLPKGKSKVHEVPSVEMELTGPDVELLKGKVSLQKDQSSETDLPTGKAKGKLKGPQKVTLGLETGTHKEAGLHVEDEHKGLKLKMPTIDVKGPQGDLELDIGLHKEEGKKDKTKIELPDLDLNTGTSGKVKEPKVKGKKFKIGLPKKKTGGDVTVGVKPTGESKVQHKGQSNDKDQIDIPTAEVTLPSVSLETKTGGDKGNSSFHKEIKVPRIPDIEFDIGTSQDEEGDKTEMDKKVKIPKFGVPLPSLTSPDRAMNICRPEVQYEGPKMPKVKKAVFVLVKPNEADEAAASASVPKAETTAENKTEEVKGKMPKIKMKPSFGKSKEKTVAVGSEREEEEEETSKGEKFKMPKVSFSPGKMGSFDVTQKEDSSSSNGEKYASPHKSSKNDKGTFSGKIKLPKVEFTSPYSKMAASGEKTETIGKMGKDSSPRGVREDNRKLGEMAFMSDAPETSTHVVSSHARTEMLDRDSSESPVGFSTEFSSTKIQTWSEMESRGNEAEEKDSSSWFKVPKITLKPHTSGFLQITPEGSPQAQRRGEVGGEADVSGSFCLHTSGLDFSTQQTSEEHQVSSTEEGTVTTVTQTTRITRHLVTSETRTGESKTRQATDF
ncbi:neuroblast differentiation-associated protein AHNAK isoform X2 [Kryptolebias marmoratus]|uniref:neuroblast differentiation-associated protein AHNAK isoform X2 n=1 Tax=Kryptolebias marmoratus TaxID=37003 RepID=UPI000D52FE2F|nr:neuroblast differentiation-associated protein AHNAK isoform X2 [Kryptolebias marmoratus]